MKSFFRLLSFWLIAFSTPTLAAEFLEDASLAVRLSAIRTGASALRVAARPPAAIAPQQHTIDSLRSQFSAARRPEVGDLRLQQRWTCYSVVNKTGTPQNPIDEVTFHQFNGKVLSTGSVPEGTLEYESNAGSLFAAFRGGKKNSFWFVPTYRVVSDGLLAREVSILWLNLPLGNPSGIRYTETIGVPRGEYGKITGLNIDGTAYSYGLCTPAGTPAP